MMHHSYLALGSNLETPKKQVSTAINALANMASSKLLLQSNLYQTKPLLPAERPNESQEDYINAVVKIKTSLSPQELLQKTQALEAEMGRVRSEKRWQARIIDIDILLYDDVCIETPELKIPHPEMQKRLFVIEPLYEIAPDLVLSNSNYIKDLYLKLKSQL